MASAHPTGSATGLVADAVREAIAGGAPFRIVGGGTWLDAGAPVQATRTVSVAGATGIVEYVPGDLTLTARAGTSLEVIADATAAHDQWLPLDPFGSPQGTIGATVATGSAGPLAHAFGGPRDLVLGVECVTGRGEVVRAGGRVAKNVAGFDLTRLFTGSWGTLGVISEVTVRLRARPEVDITLVMPLSHSLAELDGVVRSLRTARIEPASLELVNSRLATALGLGDQPAILARLCGNSDMIAAQRRVLGSLRAVAEVSPRIWDAFRVIEPAAAWVWRMSDVPARIAHTWRSAEAIVGPATGAMVHAAIGRGVVRCVAQPHDPSNRDSSDPLLTGQYLATAIRGSTFGGTMIFERLPAERCADLAAPATDDPISRRVREAFDPNRLLNPGIFGERAR